MKNTEKYNHSEHEALYQDKKFACRDACLSIQKLGMILDNSGVTAFEYHVEEDKLIIYDKIIHVREEMPAYLEKMPDNDRIHPEDRWKASEFFTQRLEGPVDLRIMRNGQMGIYRINASRIQENGKPVLVGSIKNITRDMYSKKNLEILANTDSLTSLYNRSFGKKLINEYLAAKNPYASCGMLVIDIDYFKDVNDTYGHLFGDRVLSELASLLLQLFDSRDIVMRAGGDEFVVFMKDISNKMLVKKAMGLVKKVREMSFREKEYAMTCSVGACFLPENQSGYNYEELFDNADWALYRAKRSGRNRCVFCDSLQRFNFSQNKPESLEYDIEARYLCNDVISTAFEIFEKSNSFQVAMELLLKVVGIRMQLDRITVINTDIGGESVSRQFQWHSERAPAVLQSVGSFTKEDFLTLFHSYDEYGTTVLQHDDLEMFSEDAARLLMQGEAKTVLYAAMYCEGKYVGAVSYVVCGNKRHWSKQHRRQLGELTKIISVHLAKNQNMNAWNQSAFSLPEYDRLTGLLSFSRFREEVERIIVGKSGDYSYVMMYSDLEDFKYFNQKYGYSKGDRLLRDYSNFIIENIENESETYFTRVVADQFILFLPCRRSREDLLTFVDRQNKKFVLQQRALYPEARLKIRTGIFQISSQCFSASVAIDAANYARKQVKQTEEISAALYDERLEARKNLENELINGFDTALLEHEFQIYLQPRFSLKELTLTGAEALVRWRRKDGTLFYPNQFVPLYEENGRIIDLDYCVFEQTVAFMAEQQNSGHKPLLVSVNVSALHARRDDTVERYTRIANRYGVDPSRIEIELTETATVSDYENVRKLFQQFREAGFSTSLDDFGAGYSVLNTVIDIPVNTVKIDRLFVDHCVKSKRSIHFLEKIINIIKEMGYWVICEGIETEEQLNLLREIGCDEGQGFWYAKPMPVEEFLKKAFIRRR